ncbi:MAG TPA: spermidine/putrescine ABC transporter substrate-binding protein [Symbiobacteriaceae bacterium]|nr:spermidine/putrescine ABC transporter substrate-binding protein [Symbiobacteriaceae bacterium]
MSRRVAAAILAVLLMTLAAGCAKSGKTLHLYSWAEYFPDEVLGEFEKEFGARVTYDTYPSNEDMAAKLRAGGGQYDVAVPSTYAVHSLAADGLLQPLDAAKLTNLKNIAPEFLNQAHDRGNKYSVPYMWGTLGIAYNSKYVKTAPEQWSDLLNPEYKDRIVAVDDGRDIIGLGLQAVGHSRNTTDPAKVQAAQEWLKQLMPNVKAWDSDNPKAMLISGEAWIGLVWNGDAALAMKENPDIRYALPKNRGSLWLDSLVIPKGAHNAQLAHDFINFMLRPEIAAKVGVAYPYGMANAEGVKLLPADVKSNPASYPPQEWVARAELAGDLGEAATLFDKAFTELKAGQ